MKVHPTAAVFKGKPSTYNLLTIQKRGPWKINNMKSQLYLSKLNHLTVLTIFSLGWGLKDVFPAIGACRVEICNTSLLPGVFPNPLKPDAVEPKLKRAILIPQSWKITDPSPWSILCQNFLRSRARTASFMEKYERSLINFSLVFITSPEITLLKVSSIILRSADSKASTVMVLLERVSALNTVGP